MYRILECCVLGKLNRPVNISIVNNITKIEQVGLNILTFDVLYVQS